MNLSKNVIKPSGLGSNAVRTIFTAPLFSQLTLKTGAQHSWSKYCRGFLVRPNFGAAFGSAPSGLFWQTTAGSQLRSIRQRRGTSSDRFRRRISAPNRWIRRRRWRRFRCRLWRRRRCCRRRFCCWTRPVVDVIKLFFSFHRHRRLDKLGYFSS